MDDLASVSKVGMGMVLHRASPHRLPGQYTRGPRSRLLEMRPLVLVLVLLLRWRSLIDNLTIKAWG